MENVELVDVRRLTGPSLLADRPGAILDVACDAPTGERIDAAWRSEVRRLLPVLGWENEELASRSFPGGISLVMTAPIDVLYAATEVGEWALDVALAQIRGADLPDAEEATQRLRGLIEEESNPALLRLRDAARRQGVTFLSDDDHASVGLGEGSLTFDANDLPAPDTMEWSRVRDVPVVLVTGTNGKSTTVRLLASMVSAAGMVPGSSSTDGVVVGGTLVEEGDYSGPEGARRVLRDPRTEVAILETARGGLVRRGLAVTRADAAVVTNIAEDHLGDFGLTDLDTLARIKLVVARAVSDPADIVLNAEDPRLVGSASEWPGRPAWFALDAGNENVRSAAATGGAAAWLDGRTIQLAAGGTVEPVVGVGEIPIALDGAARHNVANALAAVLVAAGLGLDRPAIAEGLRRFSGGPEENPGRANVFDIGGVTAIVDYAHNPAGYRALFDTAAAIPATRRLVVLGQAGDRPDEAIRDLARIAWGIGPDRIVVKEMETLLRGRERGEVPALIEDELGRLGMPTGNVSRAADEMAAVRDALAWARPGDLLYLLIHEQRPAVLDLLGNLARGD